MKKLFLSIIVLVLSNYALLTQDRIDPRKLFNHTTDTVFYSGISGFIKGWNWSGVGRKLDSALGINYHHHLFTNQTDFMDSPRLLQPIIQSSGAHLSTRNAYSVLNANALYLEPTLNVDSTGNFVPRINDSTGAVFGFYYKNVGSISDTGADYHRYKLYKNNLDSNSELVLSNIWMNNALKYENYTDVKDSTYLNNERIFISINLKSLEQIPANMPDTTTILSIKVPYTYLHYHIDPNGGGWILDSTTYNNSKFYALPRVSSNPVSDIFIIISTNSFNDTLGIARLMASPLPGTPDIRVWNITAGMLRVDTLGTGNRNITLSAEMRYDSLTFNNQLIHNPLLQPDGYDHPTITKYISNLGLDVRYYGHLNIAIDWLRFETPRAQEVFRGHWDHFIDSSVTVELNRIRNSSRNMKLFRFYTADEMIPMQWAANRYFNMLVDTLASSEVYVSAPSGQDDPPVQFQHALGFKEFCTGSTIYHNVNMPAAPFIRKASVSWLLGPMHQTFDYLFGYRGNNYIWRGVQVFNFPDTLNSEYETFLLHANGGSPYSWSYYVNLPLSGSDTLLYDKTNYSSDYYILLSTQAAIEYCLYKNYYKYTNWLFSNKPWYANLWVTSGLNCDLASGDSSFYYTYRPKTGEEIRMMINSPLILGAKGLFYYMKGRWDHLPNNIESGFQIDDDPNFLANLPSGDSLIYSDVNGGDYVNINDDNYYDFKQNFDSTKYNWDSLGTRPNRIYFGLKSSQVEINKIHKWIKSVEDTLLDLRLVAWRGKGFKKWDCQYKLTTYSLIGKYVDLANIKTRKIWDEKYRTWNSQPESYDSSFFDITRLRQSLDTNLTSNITYFGILNRRTDPLVRPLDTVRIRGVLQTDSTLKFYSTADFDNHIVHGGNIYSFNSSYWRDSNYWQNLWWKRLGCRELTIPFDYNGTPTQFDGYILHVSELGANDASLNSQPWRGSKYYHKIDTVITEDGSVVIRMLPGEGKILKVVVNSIAGNPMQDTCAGCLKITQNISVQSGSGTCNGGKKCWPFTIKNNSNCNYDSLNLAAEFSGTNPDSMTFSFSNSGWDTTSGNTGGKNYKFFNGNLFAGDSLNLNICYPVTDSFNMKFKIGKIINGQFFACDSVLDSLKYNGFNCNDVNVNLAANPAGNCACNECGYLLTSTPIDTCFANNWKIKFKSPGKPDSTANGNGFKPQGTIIDSLCIRDGIDSVVVELRRDSNVVCTQGIGVNCNKCDSIKIVNIKPTYWDVLACVAKYDASACVAEYYIILNNLKNCIKKFDFIEVSSHGDIILESNIPTNGQDTIIRKYCYCGEVKYRYVFKDSLGNELCEDSVEHYCRCTAITTIVNLTNPHPFCCGGITVIKIDSTLPPVYAIGIAEPSYPDQFVYFERRDSNQIPFNLDYPGYFVTTLCVPEDSLLCFNIYLWDIDTNLVGADHYEGSCMSEKLNTQMYIGKFDAYPNPANSSITFAYTLLQSANVQLQLYDDMGNLIDKIFSGKQGKGSYKYPYSTKNLKEGLYYGVLWANTEYKTIGIIIMH